MNIACFFEARTVFAEWALVQPHEGGTRNKVSLSKATVTVLYIRSPESRVLKMSMLQTMGSLVWTPNLESLRNTRFTWRKKWGPYFKPHQQTDKRSSAQFGVDDPKGSKSIQNT